jgi:exodeoxyribonuclease VIII
MNRAIIDHLSNADYHADPAVSASHLHQVARSGQHYWARYVDPDRQPVKPTAAMTTGSLVHCAVLEPDELLKRYGACPPRNTKAGKEAAAEMQANGVEPVSETDMLLAQRMASAVHHHPMAALLLSGGQPETSIWWDDPETGLRCKCRPDWINGSTCVDLKTTTDASPKGFARSVASFRYHVQDAHYLASGLFDQFIFIAVEKEAPFAVGVYALDADALSEGQRLRDRDLQRIANCRAMAAWPGYGDELQILSLPAWSYGSGSDTITPIDF